MKHPDERLDAFARLLEVVDRLRGPGGCPWDRDQSLESIAPHLLEEAYEVADTMLEGDRGKMSGELGDLLMNILLASRIAEDAGDFSLRDVSESIADKLVRRHPHVFEAREVDGVEGVLRNWEDIKRRERQDDADASTLAGIPAALPALLRAYRMGEKAARVGFKWDDVSGAIDKLDEEMDELKRAVANGDEAHIEEELGDVLFCVVNVARHMEVNPEVALRRTSSRFSERFRYLEKNVGRPISEATPQELERLWREAKKKLIEDPLVPPGTPDEWRDAVRRMRRTRDALMKSVRDLPDDLLTASPPESVSAWSILEVLDHLERAERSVGRALTSVLRSADGVAPFPPEGLAAYPPKNRLYIPDQTVAAPPGSLPSRDRSRAALLTALKDSRAALMELLPDLSRLNPRELLHEHFFFGDLDALQWFEFVAGHEGIHLEQVERIRRAFTSGE